VALAAAVVLLTGGDDDATPITSDTPTITGPGVTTQPTTLGTTQPTTQPTVAPTTVSPLVVPPTPLGFTAQTDQAAGYTVALPSSWQVVAVEGADAAATLAAIGGTSPGQSSAMAFVGAQLQQGGQVFAVDTFLGATVSLVKLPAASPTDPNIGAGALQQQLIGLGATDAELEQDVIPAGAAVQMTAEFRFLLPNGTDDSVDLELYVLRGATASWLLVLTSPDDSDTGDFFDVVVDSLRVI
jgi:hypothetical protein